MDLRNPEIIQLPDLLQARFNEVSQSADAAVIVFGYMDRTHLEHSQRTERLLPNRSVDFARDLAAKYDYLSDFGIVSSEHTEEAGREAAAELVNMNPKEVVEGTKHVEAVLNSAKKLQGHMPQPSAEAERQFQARRKLERLYGANQ